MLHTVQPPAGIFVGTRRRLAALGALFAMAMCLTMAGPHLQARPLSPAVGIGGSAKISVSTARSSPELLRDGHPAPGRDDVGRAWTGPARAGEWVQFRWSSAQRITSVQIYGSSSGARITAGVLTFDNNTSLQVGEIIKNPVFPTIVAFRPMSVTWVRFTVTQVVGPGALSLAELRVYPVGGSPLRYGLPDAKTAAADGENSPCLPSTPREVHAGVLYVLCPLTYSRVRGTRPITVHAAGLTKVGVTAWSAQGGTPALTESVVPVLADRAIASMAFDRLPNGPVTVQVRGVAGPSLSASSPTYFQVYNAGGSASSGQGTGPGSRGKTLVYADNFTRPPSFSQEGRNPAADYAAGKPEYWGVSQFGQAIFPDPARRFGNLNTVDGRYLRLTVQPLPRGYTDPNGWGRQHIGAIMSPARPGGSGFSARYGYFEARILAPAAPGTWPAFWLLPSENLIQPKTTVAEIDAVELYGHDPRGACHTTHSYTSGGNTTGVARCGQRFGSVSDALRWHVYAVSVEPTEIIYWIDGKVVARAPQVNGGDKPMFFMLDLDLGGGWPLRLDPVQNRAAMYVDWVRVYV
jgi:hypothetical protein